MLSKILKYEMKATIKPMAIINAMVIFSTIIGFFYVANLDVEEILRTENSTSFAIMLMLGIMYIVGLAISSFVSYLVILIRYGKTMYGSNGYLSWTLPVKRGTLINGKLINGVIWSIVNIVICVGSFCWLLAFYLSKAGVNLHDVIHGIPSEITGHFILPMLMLLLIGVIASVFIGYFCITVGQLMKEHKVLGTIIAFVGVYIVQQVANTIVIVGGGFFSYMNQPTVHATATGFDMEYLGIYDTMVYGQIAVILVIALVSLVACHLIPRKKINLD